MARIKIDPGKKLCKIKPMHGGGQPPLVGAKTMHFHYMTEAGIPYSRLHDVGGAYGGNRFVDVPNIFRSFDADETLPESYDFTFTDHLISELVKAGVEPYYRLGITIENDARIKPYYTAPPADYEKWARICEHIIRHYTEGWANGFHYKITYWEIWNEPDNGIQMWSGSDEDFFRLYDVTAKHLKACFPHLKIGGFASCGFYSAVGGGNPWQANAYTAGDERRVEYFRNFMKYIKAQGSPIDFFSWHTYSTVEYALKMDEWLDRELKELGFEGLETHLNEWNPIADEFGTGRHSAQVAAIMLGMQCGHAEVLCIYDMRTTNAPYCALFDVCTHKPIHAYYSLVAFNKLYELGEQVYLENDTEGLYAVAASNGNRHALMIANTSGRAHSLEIEGADLSNARFYVIDDNRLLSWAPNCSEISKDTVMLIEF